MLFEQLADDFGSGGFAIGARNYDNAVRKFAENLFDEIFVGNSSENDPELLKFVRNNIEYNRNNERNYMITNTIKQ